MDHLLRFDLSAGGCGIYGPGLGGGSSKSNSLIRRAKAARESRSMATVG